MIALKTSVARYQEFAQSQKEMEEELEASGVIMDGSEKDYSVIHNAEKDSIRLYNSGVLQTAHQVSQMWL